MYNMCESYIKMQIEELRIKLNNLVDEKINSLVDMDVVKLSEKMDLLLLQYMKQQKNKRILIKDF
ncbi:aspartyl-phosphate phosphatase Spo0E family protein [Clostridium novyi]|nr:aspartyl-phosphate phosphatase Spo0E family protein [Clostridium novyi]